jgi:hypothetical protein
MNIDFANFTFSAEQIRDVRELLKLKVIDFSMFSQYHDVWTGIQYDKEIGWLGELPDIGRPSRGCNPAVDAALVPGVKKTWTPKEYDVRLSTCYTDLATTMAVYARKMGTDVQDLTSTDYLNIVVEKAEEAMNRFMWRLWFTQTNHSVVGAGIGSQLLTVGTDPTLFTLLNGYWHQIFAIVAANPTQRTNLAANAEATAALQFSELTPALALSTLMDATYNMPVELVQSPNKVGMITRYFANQVKRAFQTVNTHPDAYSATKDGVEVLKVNGVEFVISDEWTRIIQQYFNLGATFHLPHRAVITTKENLAYGIESNGTLNTFKVFHDDTLRRSYVDLIDRVDVKVLQDRLIQVVY